LDALVLPITAPLPPSSAELDEAVAILSKAKRPMIWLGNGAKQAGAEAARLMALGFGVVSSWNGRGIIPEDHPMSLGALHGNGSPRVQEFYGSVDAMLVVGSRLRGHETMDFNMKLPETLIRVDGDAAANGRGYASSLFLHGDAALTMAALADPSAAGKVFELGGPRVMSMRQVLRYILDVTQRHRPMIALPEGFVRLQARLGELLPTPPLTRDQLILLGKDNVVSPNALGFQALGIEPKAVEAIVPAYLARFRQGGQRARVAA
jgi:glyoxylate carboligase